VRLLGDAHHLHDPARPFALLDAVRGVSVGVHEVEEGGGAAPLPFAVEQHVVPPGVAAAERARNGRYPPPVDLGEEQPRLGGVDLTDAAGVGCSGAERRAAAGDLDGSAQGGDAVSEAAVDRALARGQQ
jgi:hypothetical protein